MSEPTIQEKYGFVLGALSNIKWSALAKGNAEILVQIQRIADYTGVEGLNIPNIENMNCNTCRHHELSIGSDTCYNCLNTGLKMKIFPNWTPK